MSFDLFHRAQQHPGLSQTQKGVLVALVTFADGDGWSWPSVATLAGYVGVKDRAVQRAVADLQEAGLVFRQDRTGASTRYRVMVDRLVQRGGVLKTPPSQKHPRLTDTPVLKAGEGCLTDGGGGVLKAGEGCFSDTLRSQLRSHSEDTNERAKGEAPPPKQEQGVQEVKFGPSSSPPPKAEEVQESPLLPLLMNAGLNLGAASGVINAFRVANVLTLADASTLDEWELGRIAGVNRKVATIKAFRAGGWLPPKERAVAPPPRAGVVIDANGGFYEPPKTTKKDNIMSALHRLAVEEVADGQPSSNY